MYNIAMNRQARQERPTVSARLSERDGAALLWRLERAGHRIDEGLESALSAYGLSSAKLGVLKHLVLADEPLPLGHLAARLTCVKSNITQLVDRLERDGLVQRVHDSDDRRCLRAAITEEGRRRCALGTKAELEVEQVLLSSFSRREQKELALLLAKLDLDGQ